MKLFTYARLLFFLEEHMTIEYLSLLYYSLKTPPVYIIPQFRSNVLVCQKLQTYQAGIMAQLPGDLAVKAG